MLILYHTMRHYIRKKLQHSLPGLSHGAWSLQSLFAASAPWKIFGPLKLVPLGLSFDKFLMVYNYNDHKIEVILITDYLIPFPLLPYDHIASKSLSNLVSDVCSLDSRESLTSTESQNHIEGTFGGAPCDFAGLKGVSKFVDQSGA